MSAQIVRIAANIRESTLEHLKMMRPVDIPMDAWVDHLLCAALAQHDEWLLEAVDSGIVQRASAAVERARARRAEADEIIRRMHREGEL